MPCHRCGLCCECLFLPTIIVEKLSKNNHPDAVFVLQHWKRVLYKEGIEKVKWLTSFLLDEMVFFECDLYDKKRYLCKVYEERPDVCKRYPWYGDLPSLLIVLPPGCGYAIGIRETHSVKMVKVHREREHLRQVGVFYKRELI